MRTSQRGIDLIKSFEGLKLTAYYDMVGVLTIGWGHTGTVIPGQTISEDDAESLLRADLIHFENGIERRVTVPLTQNQFDSLVSFTYNVGLGAFDKSTLLIKLNDGDINGCAEEFDRWTKAGGKIAPGLVRRRTAERDLFLRPPDNA